MLIERAHRSGQTGRALTDIGRRRHSAVRLSEKVQALQSRQTYPHTPLSVTGIETHFAWVFLVDGLAYKLKKPLRTDAFDLRSLAARRRACCAELRLNRRLAPDVYLGLASLSCDRAGVLSVNGRGRVVDWLVTMRRLPAELMLDHAIRAGAAAPDRLLAVGRTLADFYARQKPARVRPRDYVRGLVGQIQKDCAELALGASIGADVAAIRATLQAAAPRLEAALAERVLAGRVVEGHGDLRPEHICLSDPPRIIDCLEFSRRLRTLDAAEELAFFAVECECLGAEWAAERVIDGYAERAGDAIPGPVFDFFRSRRALVRAKLLARRWRTDDAAASKRWSDRTQMYLALAQRYAVRALEHAGAPACPGSSRLAFMERPAL